MKRYRRLAKFFAYASSEAADIERKARPQPLKFRFQTQTPLATHVADVLGPKTSVFARSRMHAAIRKLTRSLPFFSLNLLLSAAAKRSAESKFRRYE